MTGGTSGVFDILKADVEKTYGARTRGSDILSQVHKATCVPVLYEQTLQAFATWLFERLAEILKGRQNIFGDSVRSVRFGKNVQYVHVADVLAHSYAPPEDHQPRRVYKHKASVRPSSASSRTTSRARVCCRFRAKTEDGVRHECPTGTIDLHVGEGCRRSPPPFSPPSMPRCRAHLRR